MQHYFGTIVDGHAILDSAQRHHLVDVRRAQIKERVEIADGADVFLCEVVSLDPLDIIVVGKSEERRELDNELILAFATLKSDHNDLIVLKGAELGVSRFIPFVSERTVVKPKEPEDNKILRLRKIALEGAQQCRRAITPKVDGYARFVDILDIEADIKMFAYEGQAGDSNSLLDIAKSVEKNRSILVVIGPEGGFSDVEAEMARNAGFQFVSLGRRILRAETAALYAASVLSAFSEEGK